MRKFYHLLDIRDGFRPQKKWTVFLDRDGTINKEVHLLHKLKDFALIPEAVEAIRLLNKNKIPVIVYHNASVIARGLCDEAQVVKLNERLKEELMKQEAFVDMILFCPHHPTAFNPERVYDCSWRKPKAGMLEFAAKLFNLNLKKSYVVGDAARDILMGQAAGCFTIGVKTGHAGKEGVYEATPDKTTANILTAVKFILEKERLR